MNKIVLVKEGESSKKFEWRLIQKDEKMLLSDAENLCKEGGWEVGSEEHLKAIQEQFPEEAAMGPVIAIGPTYGAGMKRPYSLQGGEIETHKLQYWIYLFESCCRYLSVRKV